ncbi:mucin-3A-like [Branchiostoma lanceolatum]|uniref:mucin-3A-like n=1 Tax=Branchiostoma lanceolatum TaxID=7740 RepID=UPI0034551B64
MTTTGTSGPSTIVSTSATTSDTTSQATTSQHTTATAGPTTTGPTALYTTTQTTPEGTTQPTTSGPTTQAGTGSTVLPTTVTSFSTSQSATQSTTQQTTSDTTQTTAPTTSQATTVSAHLTTSPSTLFTSSFTTSDTTSVVETTHLIGIQSTSTLSEITSQEHSVFTTLQNTKVSQPTAFRGTSFSIGDNANPASTIISLSETTEEPITSVSPSDAVGKSSTQPTTTYVITGVIGRRSSLQTTSLSATNPPDESTTLPTTQTATSTENIAPASTKPSLSTEVTNRPVSDSSATQTTAHQASTLTTLFDITACQQEVARLQTQNEQLLRIIYGTASIASLLLVISTKVIVQAAYNLYKKLKLRRGQRNLPRPPSAERRITPEGSEGQGSTTNVRQTNDIEQGVKKTNAWQPILPPVQTSSRTITLPAPRRASDGNLSRPKLTFFRRGGVVVPVPTSGAGPFSSTQDLAETRLSSDETFMVRKSKQGDLILPKLPINIRHAVPTSATSVAPLPAMQARDTPATSPEETILAMKAKQEDVLLPKLPLPRRGSNPIRTREPLPSVQTLLSNAALQPAQKKTEDDLRHSQTTPLEEGQDEIPGVVNAEELSLPPVQGAVPKHDDTSPAKEIPKARMETKDEQDEEEADLTIKEETDEQLEEERNKLQDRRGSKLTDEDKQRMEEILKAQTERRKEKMRKRREKRRKKEEEQRNVEEEERRKREEQQRRSSIIEDEKVIVVAEQKRKIMEEERIKVEAPILDDLEPALEGHNAHELEATISAFYSAKLTDDTGLLKESEGIYDAIQAQHDLTAAFEKRDLETLDSAIAAAERVVNMRASRPAPPPVKPGGVDPLRARRMEMWRKAAEESKKVTDRLARQLHQADKIKQLEKLRREVLEASQVTISEIRNYNHPPQKVHQVMTATYLLLGVKERETEDWRNVQALMGHSLTKKIQHINPSRVRLQTAMRAQQILSNFTGGQIRDVSAGAAAFYHWAQGVIQVVIAGHHTKV